MCKECWVGLHLVLLRRSDEAHKQDVLMRMCVRERVKQWEGEENLASTQGLE